MPARVATDLRVVILIQCDAFAPKAPLSSSARTASRLRRRSCGANGLWCKRLPPASPTHHDHDHATAIRQYGAHQYVSANWQMLDFTTREGQRGGSVGCLPLRAVGAADGLCLLRRWQVFWVHLLPRHLSRRAGENERDDHSPRCAHYVPRPNHHHLLSFPNTQTHTCSAPVNTAQNLIEQPCPSTPTTTASAPQTTAVQFGAWVPRLTATVPRPLPL